MKSASGVSQAGGCWNILEYQFTDNPVLGANAVYNNDRLESPTEVQPLRLVTANPS
jgi:hypothetical protein